MSAYHVYVMYDERNRVLYVGQTSNLSRRMREHANSSHWFGQVRTIATLEADTVTEALALETQRINTLRPAHNVATTASYTETVQDAINYHTWEQIGAGEEPDYPESMTTADWRDLRLQQIRNGRRVAA